MLLSAIIIILSLLSTYFCYYYYLVHKYLFNNNLFLMCHLFIFLPFFENLTNKGSRSNFVDSWHLTNRCFVIYIIIKLYIYYVRIFLLLSHSLLFFKLVSDVLSFSIVNYLLLHYYYCSCIIMLPSQMFLYLFLEFTTL